MTSRKPIVAGNWKMNTSIAEGLALVDEMLPRLQAIEAVERVVCPPFISLSAIADRLRGTSVGVGAQNMHPEPKGAFTGEIAPGMLEGLATYVILGHSERRQYFSEDDAFVNRKVRAALGIGLVPIVCVGETLEQNEQGETEAVVTRQLRGALDGVEHISGVVKGANKTIALIRGTIASLAGEPTASGVRIQYGGSVTPDNFAAFIGQPDIDGALVGGASLKADSFVDIVRLAAAQP